MTPNARTFIGHSIKSFSNNRVRLVFGEIVSSTPSLGGHIHEKYQQWSKIGKLNIGRNVMKHFFDAVKTLDELGLCCAEGMTEKNNSEIPSGPCTCKPKALLGAEFAAK